MDIGYSVVVPRIKKYPPHVELTTCTICGGPACYHFYGALACDSCRTFFRRFLLKSRYSKCINGDDCCDVTPESRKDCPTCRFNRCLAAGMKPELVTTQMDPESALAQMKQPRSYRRQPTLIVQPIIRPLISLLDTQIMGLTKKEKTKVYEMLNVTMSTILNSEDTADLKCTPPRTALFTTFFRSIAKVVKALATLKSKDYIGLKSQEILMKGSVSEMIFLRSVPFLDYENRSWKFHQNPFDKDTEVVRQIPLEILKYFSDALYNEYEAWVGGLHPEARKDFIFMAIVSAIDYYDPTRENLENTTLIKHEHDIFCNILFKYLKTKLGPQFIEDSFRGKTVADRLNDRVLNRAHVIKDLYENLVFNPSEVDNLLPLKCHAKSG